MAKNLTAMWRPGFDCWVGKYPGEETATHASVPACRTPWTEEAGGLSKVSQTAPWLFFWVGESN